MVMPSNIPSYLEPQDLSNIGAWTAITITPAGADALESARATGADGQVLEALNAGEETQYVAKLMDNANVHPLDVIRPVLARLGRQGFIRIGVKKEG